MLDVFNEEDNLLEKLGIRKHVKPEDRNEEEKRAWQEHLRKEEENKAKAEELVK